MLKEVEKFIKQEVIVKLQVMYLLLVRNNVITTNDLNTGKNIIYGIGNGADVLETINYTQFEPGVDISYLLHNINQMNTNFQDKMYNNH